MAWIRVPAQASEGDYAQHFIFHTCMKATWTRCLL
eukprot:CAMPEP_0172647244 /NCGR_PEP_ID=MMETSP1068-20121228/240652_1 /TAXON_ID=35684 /ORGANISM="Pseudopedinella elastica, Strain CCMP716" /LENGTH=34 /DNA_ID= /DNA_START= /DNA_END= /DNA_ORIENTATION=